ncbi:maleylpyruvate isomerase family mycothiol-dependent enzyme [Amycolatopsis thermophila]|uniref:Uncharacterized protein (TIGR03083 family) n=1 Tax=Amycolatopsis thermophila TaxID=206084 RepID=A0ABU0F0N8_9PSEU|nr:maleylpyruvate isomerase family mycothiol-dependent enzyme [Amycolatopsis thermophila]MDQ0380632.1 uncharacterized protein (TIGR03083 family) [Amycolatopsis thermophila]
MTKPDQPFLLDTLRAEIHGIGVLATPADPDLPVPACPGWTTGTLVEHLGGVAHRVTAWVDTQTPPLEWEREPSAGQDALEWFRAAADGLFRSLASRPPSFPCQTWSPADRTFGFWRRRMAHEFTVHRVDLEQALGMPPVVDPVLAADGVDEVLTLWLAEPNRPAPGPAVTVTGRGEVIQVRCPGRVWTVRMPDGEGDPDVLREAAGAADGRVAGDAPDVYLWLWGRGTAHPLEVTGEAAVLRRVLAACTR